VYKLHGNDQLISTSTTKKSSIPAHSVQALPREISDSSALSPAIQELVRFIEVSAGCRSYRRPDEVAYHEKLTQDPECYLCFRERNETYKRALSMLNGESKDKPSFLARWMLYRTYTWGVSRVQDTLEAEFSCPEDVFDVREAVSREFSDEAAIVTTYGPQYKLRLPTTLDAMKEIWDCGINVWSDWRENLPIPFDQARKSITSRSVPMYSTGYVSQLLLFGDLSRLGIILPPTESQMAKLIWDSRSGARRGLRILGVRESVNGIREAVPQIRTALNDHLPDPVKSLFHSGEVSVFDLEHVLCKVS
jgi:hypothetical protein